MRASLRLTRWLRCRWESKIDDVIGHSESLSSPYHRELNAHLRDDTHSDWQKTSMDDYRRRLRAQVLSSRSRTRQRAIHW